MADKKITALTALGATDVAPAADLLHIIDYSASPVNKKVTVANLFSNVNTDTHIYGASKTFDIGHAVAKSALKILTNTVANGAESTVTINGNEDDYIDFTVHSTGGEAISVDASADSVTINSDAIAAMDFVVKGDTTTLIHCDGGLDAVGIGMVPVNTAYTMSVAATGTLGILSAGSIHVTGEVTATTDMSATGNLTVTGFMIWNDAIAGTSLVGGANVGAKVEIPVVDLVTHLDPGSSTGHYGIANGAAGQVKFIFNSDAAEVATLTPTSLAQVGNTLTLQAGETALMLYTTGGWCVFGSYGGAVTQV